MESVITISAPTMNKSSCDRAFSIRFWSGWVMIGLWLYMNTTFTGGSNELSSNISEVSTMLIVLVPTGTRSGLRSRSVVFGKEFPTLAKTPAPNRPWLPVRACKAIAARIPDPPLWPRSSPLPTETPTTFPPAYSSASLLNFLMSILQISTTISGVCIRAFSI